MVEKQGPCLMAAPQVHQAREPALPVGQNPQPPSWLQSLVPASEGSTQTPVVLENKTCSPWSPQRQFSQLDTHIRAKLETSQRYLGAARQPGVRPTPPSGERPKPMKWGWTLEARGDAVTLADMGAHIKHQEPHVLEPGFHKDSPQL